MIRIAIGTLLMGLGVWLVAMPLPTEMSGLCLLGFGFLFLAHWFVDRKKLKKGWKIAVWSVGIGVFAAISVAIAVISFQGVSQWEEARQRDYAVILGAQIWGDQPSLILQQRLDEAMVFLEENPDAIVIVSGAQGKDEIMTEASVMARYLLEQGADPDRVYVEEKATNTRENLIYSAQMAEELGLDADSPVIVTSEFHMARSKYIARSLDLDAVGVSSQTHPLPTKVNALVREVFAFVKAWVVAGAA